MTSAMPTSCRGIEVMRVSRWLAWSFAALLIALPPVWAHPVHPDLVIEDAQIAAAQPARLRIKVANQGIAPAPQNQLRVYFHRPDTVLERLAVVPALETGERQWLVLEAGSAVVGAAKVTVVIDELGQVDETDEGNNVYVLE